MDPWSVRVSANVETYTRLKRFEFTVKCTETQTLLVGELGPNTDGKIMNGQHGAPEVQKGRRLGLSPACATGSPGDAGNSLK